MNVLQSRDDRYIIATLFGKDDFVFSVYPKSEKHELEQNQFRSTYFYYPQDIKFTEKGMGGLYFYTPEILTLKLRELTKKAQIWYAKQVLFEEMSYAQKDRDDRKGSTDERDNGFFMVYNAVDEIVCALGLENEYKKYLEAQGE